MALRGKGMLIVYTDIAARDERDFNEWYNREHIDERVNLPGFNRGRRYVSVKGSPKYLATYECEAAELTGSVDRLLADTALQERLAAMARRLQSRSGTIVAADLIEHVERISE